MEVLLDNLDWNEQYRSVDEYLAEQRPREGAEFTLVKATVLTAMTYRIVNGHATPVTVLVGAKLPTIDV
jgi:hypothetical protein